uniref:Uncharacterized protein n=1 Tax=Arundo donax TaxID=35708 RepID=A0A0A8ZZF7_ARUDO
MSLLVLVQEGLKIDSRFKFAFDFKYRNVFIKFDNIGDAARISNAIISCNGDSLKFIKVENCDIFPEAEDETLITVVHRHQ